MKVDKRLLQPLSQQSNTLRGLAPIQQSEKTRVLISSLLLGARHEVECSQSGRVKLHVLREIVVSERILGVVGFVAHKMHVRDKCRGGTHRLFQAEFRWS